MDDPSGIIKNDEKAQIKSIAISHLIMMRNT